MDTDKKTLEKYSSAFTLSDMELFIFPELLYAGLLANIMSPNIWRWRDDPWFAGIDSMNEMQRIQRLKQYIIDHYVFNLDLETWGLTAKETEMARFADFIDLETLKQSNALFGYEGDKYYFDIGIRKHFGLDGFTDNIIPYWKTETVEAMDAFELKEGYTKRAGECVSLAMLYAAALFIVAKVPLNKIFLMGTPLHSQNFVLAGHGVLTNNRRIVTKNMWFNGTEISAKARRALEHEKVTILAHATGVLHYFYDEATISREAYEEFKRGLSSYLTSDLGFGILASFLRDRTHFQQYFQFRKKNGERVCHLTCEKAFSNEHGTKNSLSEVSGRRAILEDIECDEYYCKQIPDRIVIEDVEDFIKREKIKIDKPADGERLKAKFAEYVSNADEVMTAFSEFAHCIPKLHDGGKKFVQGFTIELTGDMSRGAIIDYLAAHRTDSASVDLAFYANRDVTRMRDMQPFLYAAQNRSPVLFEKTKGMDAESVHAWLNTFRPESIYDGTRLAQPDECVNYTSADGIEKAVCLGVVMHERSPGASITIEVKDGKAQVSGSGRHYLFETQKAVSLSMTI
ncbi:MAG: hypothetical protein HZC28_05550 [Spirochaetes bacterium]|nr:hypothetical protein [Spirochaetota bacterium]